MCFCGGVLPLCVYYYQVVLSSFNYSRVGCGLRPKGMRQKAATNDDAAPPTNLWDRQLWMHFSSTIWGRAVDFLITFQKHPLDVIRTSFLLPYWRKTVWRSWRRYRLERVSKGNYEASDQQADKEGAADCLRYASRATWWEWTGGSKLFFWRWPEPIRHLARDGMKSWIKGSFPNYRVPQRRPTDEEEFQQIIAKLANVIGKGYIGPGDVKSLTSYFSVPKGIGDIRMVYDATKCGLNDILWVPSFALPDVDTLLSMVEDCTWMSDIDIGEMFLNFPLDKLLQPYCGVDVAAFFPEFRSWLMWLRCAMGLKPSPYVAIRFLLFAGEIIRGLRSSLTNVMKYDKVRLNLPGDAKYDPRLPWVSKIVTSTNKIAADYVGYVDDVRPVGPSESECNKCARQISCTLNYLGIQDAARKRQGASKTAGVWAGAIVFADGEGVGVLCTQEKWDKAKAYLKEIRAELDSHGLLNHKSLERIRGFLLYVTRTYPAMVPYLKGIHLTIDSWRPGRDSDGWRLTAAELRHHLEQGNDLQVLDQSKEPPVYVSPSYRLSDDIATLEKMTSCSSPHRRFVRSNLVLSACYGFGDASGSGFGSTVEGPGGLWYRHGLWGKDANKRSSNYRELRNLVETIEEGVDSGSLTGAELFLFTDNTVAEAAFYKGNTSSSRALFDLIVRLRMIEISGALRFWVIHVAGKRMISQGADGLSRGNLLEGVMEGKPMLAYVPLALSCLQRSPDVRMWIKSWFNESACFLSEEEWFDVGHGLTGGAINADNVWIPTSVDKGYYVWTPPPAAGRAAVDQLSISRHKRPTLTHLFACPRLFTSLWRKRLYKIADCVFEIPPGARSFWPSTMFEPLIIGLILPLSTSEPWQHRRTQPILAVEREVRQMWNDSDANDRAVLCKFFEL